VVGVSKRIRGRRSRVAGLVALAALGAGCSSSPIAPTSPPPPALAPASVVVTGGDSQVAAPGEAVSKAPQIRVTDSQGGGVSGIAVQFHVISGGGSVSTPNTATDAQGRASAGTWILGPQPGTQQLRATVAGVGSVTFSATATEGAGQPAALEILVGDGQTAEVATGLPVRPRVRVLDGDGDPASGVTVAFSVALGGGSVAGGTVVTNASGEAESGVWTLGTVAGENRLRASVQGVSSIIFEATGTAGAAAGIVAAAGDGQTATAGATVPVPPTVRVEDAYGNAVAGVAVTFAIGSGGGSISGATQTTGANGTASVGSWTLGATPGANTLVATAAGSGISGNPLSFVATGSAGGAGGAFDIVIRYNPGSSPTAAQLAAYDAAESRWEAIITGELPDQPVSRPAGTCSSPTAIDETVDDLVIFVTLETIDGPGGVLGSAGPCLIRSGSNLPAMGSMRFDTADLATLEGNGLLDEVILHEMGHVLGIGTLWPTMGLLADPAASGGTDPHFTGAGAIAAFDAIGGDSYVAGAKVPVEAGGGAGTRDGHWRESVFDTELMTGWIDATNQVSLVTVESLGDLGYEIDPGGADPYGLPASPSILPRVGGVGRISLKLEGDVERRPIEIVTPDGRRAGLVPR